MDFAIACIGAIRSPTVQHPHATYVGLLLEDIHLKPFSSELACRHKPRSARSNHSL